VSPASLFDLTGACRPRRSSIKLWSLSGIIVLMALLQAGQACLGEVSPVKDVVIVFKTHFDIGYTDLATNIVQRYRTTMIDQALKVVDQNRALPPEQQFVWTIPGWPMTKILEPWAGQSAERRQRILQAFQDGRFAVHALPFTTHTELLEPEDLVRGLHFSSDICRAIGKPLPRDAKMTDVPSHSWILPTLLKHAGVDFLHLGCNPASRSPAVPILFWWEGPDGSRLLTMYSAGDYGGGLIPPAGWPHKTWLAMMMTGDNHGPPTPDEVKHILDDARLKLPGARARVGRLSDFADALLAEKPDLPVVRGDMADTWIHGPLSDPDGAKVARNMRPAMVATDLLHTELRAWQVAVPEVQAPLEQAYEQSLLYGEHTWGGAFTWIYGRYHLTFGPEWEQERAAGKFQRIESSWQEHSSYIAHARDLVAPLLHSELDRLANSVSVAGPRVVVFNSLPWPRSGMVSLPVPAGLTRVQDAATGKSLASEVHDGNSLRFLASDVPAGGYRTYRLRTGIPAHTVPRGLRAADGQLENAYFKIKLDPSQGTIRSLIEKSTGREWVDATAPHGFGQYLFEQFDRDQVQAFVKAYVKTDAEWGTNELGKPSLPPASQVPYRGSSPAQFQSRYESSPVAVAAVMEAKPGAGVPNAVTTRVALYRDQPWIDLELTIHQKPADPWPEAGWICLPFKLEDSSFCLGRLGGLVDPAKDIVPGCNFHLFAINSGLTLVDAAGRGVGLCAIDSPLVSLGEPGGWKYSGSFGPRKPRVYVNLFNNQWSTNFRLWNSGTWSSRIRLWATHGRHPEPTLITPAADARSPLMVAFADGKPGQLPSVKAGLQLSKRGVRVSCFGSNPEGQGLLLRLWEEAGDSGACEVRLPAGLNPKVAQPVDLRGRPLGEPLPVNAGRFTAILARFAPASFVLMPKR